MIGHLWPIFALSAAGSVGWLLALVLFFRAVNAEAEVGRLRREVAWWQGKALEGARDDAAAQQIQHTDTQA
jgi:hypothetical protein